MRDGLADRRDFEATHRDDVADARDVTAGLREGRADSHCWLCNVPMLVILGIVITFAIAEAVLAVKVDGHDTALIDIRAQQAKMTEQLADIRVVRQIVEDIRDGRIGMKPGK
jgi:hypothetical protein